MLYTLDEKIYAFVEHRAAVSTMEIGTERREFKRSTGNAKARVERLAEPDVLGVLHDVSPKGFGLLLHQPLTVRENVLVRLTGTGSEEIKVPAVVIHVRRSDHGSYLVGFKLLDWIPAEKLDQLRALDRPPAE